jgi:hypothetical protein
VPKDCAAAMVAFRDSRLRKIGFSRTSPLLVSMDMYNPETLKAGRPLQAPTLMQPLQQSTCTTLVANI